MTGLDAGSAAIFGLVLLFVANRLIFLGDDWYEHRARFWGLQALNLATACALVVFGFPGIGDSKLISALIAGVVLLHILMNGNRLQNELLRERRERRMELEEENARLRAEIRQREAAQERSTE